MSTDLLEIEATVDDVILGVYGAERTHSQSVQLRVALEFESRSWGDAGCAVDYARLHAELVFILTRARFHTVEAATEALASYVLAPPTDDAPRARPVRAEVSLAKLAAMPGGLARLTVRRAAESYVEKTEVKPFGQVDILAEGAEVGLYRLRVAPGRKIPAHVHRVMQESELVLGDGLLLQGAPVARGTSVDWPLDFAHEYTNASAVAQTILCIDRPRFRPDDEIEVPGRALLPPPLRALYPPGDADTRWSL